MVCFCFLVDQTRKIKRSKPVAGTCSRCGAGASVADMRTETRLVQASNICHAPPKAAKACVILMVGKAVHMYGSRGNYFTMVGKGSVNKSNMNLAYAYSLAK
ncbi:hypothetical protein F8388_011499 [Cannabis sativa]|uniref:Uncharacterized protein n=1 Tax=Cannabis sativa TaxID=3483 RepID=A0A7J6G469_CANSA|nr:hypothetical protein F8388_011499 [Cannabis sativa]